MRLSTRNQLPATVESVHRDAADEHGLAPGTKVIVLVKSTEVMLAVD